jgi:hypothetical protein
METQTCIITYLSNEQKITQFFSESNEYFNIRLNFIKLLEKENIVWKEVIKLSKLYMNIKYKKCKYSPIVYNKIKKYL